MTSDVPRDRRATSPPPPVPDLDWDPQRARELTEAILELWVDVLASLREQRVVDAKSREEVVEAVRVKIPDEPIPQDELLAHLRSLIEHSARLGHPAFLAYICGSGTIPGAAADLLASGLATNVGGWMLAPAAREIEVHLLRWLAERLGLPPSAGGLVVSGGSIGNLVALKVARDAKAGWDVRRDGVASGAPIAIYASEEAHVTIERAADVLGVGSTAVRSVPADAALRMRVAELERLIAADLEAGIRPVAVVGTAGTTGTGAIDPLPALADVCRDRDLWFHIDAAYGGAAALADDLRPLLTGIEEADSVTLDAHKWLYTPTSAGCVILRDGDQLARSFAVSPSYVYEEADEAGRGVNPAFLGPEFSRDFRALKIWMSLLVHGSNAYGRRISHDAALARYLAARVDERPDFELALPPSLSICCFRYRPTDLAADDTSADYVDRLNERLLTELQLDGRVFPSNAVIRGRFALRVCIVNFRTEASDLDRLLDVTAELGDALDRRLRAAAVDSKAGPARF